MEDRFKQIYPEDIFFYWGYLSGLFCFSFISSSVFSYPPHPFISSPTLYSFLLHLFFSSAMFLATRCLTYFLRLLQCSPPLYRENTLTYTLRFSVTLLPLYLPPSTYHHHSPCPREAGQHQQDPPQDAPSLAEHQNPFTWTNQGMEKRFAARYDALIFYVTVAIIPCEDVNDVSNIITRSTGRRSEFSSRCSASKAEEECHYTRAK